MIVKYQEEGWEIITQRSHGLLAAQFGAQWKFDKEPSRWMEIILAIAEHDDAENELDGENLLTPAGGPLNFSMKTFEPEHCQKLSQLSLTKSRYIALLTSMHMDFLYRKEEAENKEAKAFLEAERKKREAWKKELGVSEEEAHYSYSLLEWCDALSLLLCKGELQPEKRGQEISTGPDAKEYFLLQLDEETVTVEPWPFKQNTFSVSVETRLIRQIQFSSSEEFRKAFLAAEVKEKSWKVSKQKVQRSAKKKKV